MDQPRHYRPPLSDAEYATIDLALRHWRDLPERPSTASYDGGNTVTVQLLDTPAIDALIQRLSLDFIPW